MAVVYLARDPQVGREVAIKMISADLANDPDFRRRFDREARAVARLEHSAIVPMYDHGETDGTPYLVFRYMEGGSLATRIAQRGALPIDDLADVAQRVGAALDYAHAHGVIHRDIKPANILFDRNGEAWLGDFGIAVTSERTSSLTSGAWIGSPSYMSPEQADGQPATPASDIYSLGCTLFEAVTARPPFTAEKPMAVLLKHIQQDPPLASTFRPGIPESVDQGLQRAMAKHPDERMPFGRELAEAFRTVRGFTPQPPRPAAVAVAPAVQPPPPPPSPADTRVVEAMPAAAIVHRPAQMPPPTSPVWADPAVGAPRSRQYRPPPPPPPAQGAAQYWADPGLQQGPPPAYYPEQQESPHEPGFFTTFFSFYGRASRSTYWYSILISFGVGIVASIADAILLQASEGDVSFFYALSMIPLWWAGLAIGAKRLHDTGNSAWWLLLWFVPILGWIALFIWTGFIAGTAGPNRFGPRPASWRGSSPFRR